MGIRKVTKKVTNAEIAAAARKAIAAKKKRDQISRAKRKRQGEAQNVYSKRSFKFMADDKGDAERYERLLKLKKKRKPKKKVVKQKSTKGYA
jgi:hypothetical protein